jgi:hypothetical protein
MNLLFDLPLDIQDVIVVMKKQLEQDQVYKHNYNNVIKSLHALKNTWDECFVITRDYDYTVRAIYIDNNELFNEYARDNISGFMNNLDFFVIRELCS